MGDLGGKQMGVVGQILRKHNIQTLEDLDQMMNHGPLLEDLYNYYLSSGEMPYGVAKARSGDPLQWIYERVSPLVPA